MPQRAFVLIFLLAAPTASAQSVRSALVPLLDINQQPSGGTLDQGSGFRPLGVAPTAPPTLYFSAFTAATGRELWKTQGTVATTTMVADWVPGPGSSDPEGFALLADGTVLLAMTHPDLGRELHRLPPGNDAGPELVDDARPGPEGDHFSALVTLSSRTDAYYFTQREAPGGDRGRFKLTLRRSNGMFERVVIELPVAAPRQDVDLKVAANDTIFAALDDGVSGRELWFYDPATTPLRQIVDLTPGAQGSEYVLLVTLGHEVFASADVPGAGKELVKSDGTSVTLVKDVHPGPAGSDPHDAVVCGSLVWFSCDDGQSGYEPHVTDGTAAGTRLVKDANPGAASSSPQLATCHQGNVYASCELPGIGRELCKITQTDVTVVDDTDPGAGSGDPSVIVSCGQDLCYSARDATNGRQLRAADTITPPRLLSQLPSAAGVTNPCCDDDDRCDGGGVVVLAQNLVCGWDDGSQGCEPYVVDPVTSATSQLGDLQGPRTKTLPSNAESFTYFEGRTYFHATDGVHGGELWETDGTAAGTQRLTDYNPGPASSQIENLLEFENGIFCIATNSATIGTEPHLWDPATRQFTLLADIVPGTAGSAPEAASGPFVVAASGSPLVFFAADDGVHGSELWVSDGTSPGTRLLKDIQPGSSGSRPTGFAEVNGYVLFAASTAQFGNEVWVSDGSASGTFQLTDFVSGSGSANPANFTVMGRVLYFSAFWPGFRTELFRTEGTIASTTLVKDIHATSDSFPNHLTVFRPSGQPLLAFSARDAANGNELWVTQGTEASTRLVADLRPGPQPSNPENLTAAEDLLFFTAHESTNPGDPTHLYVTDGTAVTLLPGPVDPGLLRASGRKIWFQAFDAPQSTNRELWESDGTPAGTGKHAEINRGPQSARIRSIDIAGGSVWVTADDGVTQAEPYRIARGAASATPYGSPCGPTAPYLRSTPPVLGAPMTLSGGDAPANHHAFVLLGGEPTRRGIPLLGCTTQIDLSVYLMAFVFDTAAGGAWSRTFTLPNDGSLTLGKAATWTIYVPNGTLTPFHATNGVLLMPGS